MVGALKNAQQAAGDSQPVHGERLGQTLPERHGGTGTLVGETLSR